MPKIQVIYDYIVNLTHSIVKLLIIDESKCTGTIILKSKNIMNYLFKTKGSSLTKVVNLPRYQHPADLLNLQDQPMQKQVDQIQGKL